MDKVVVVYHSYRGTTSKLVEALKKGVEKAGGQCEVLQANDANPGDVLSADTIVIASGQPFNTLAGPVKTFIEKCWVYENKARFSGKKYATIVNGSKDPIDVVAYLDQILPYFKLEKAMDGIACLGTDLENALVRSEALGEKLARG